MVDDRDFDIAGVLRAARRLVRLSQRELAEQASLPAATVARLESGTTQNPRLFTLVRLLAAARCRLLVITEAGVPLFPHPDEATRDSAGRHFPAHVDVYETPGPYDFLTERPWWGWSRNRFWRTPGRVPLETFLLRRNGYFNRRLDPRTGEPVKPGTDY